MIEQNALVTNAHSFPPDGSAYAAKMQRRADQFKEESQACREAHRTPLTPDDFGPLVKPGGLEAKDSHVSKVVGWKSNFKPGDTFMANGVRLVVRSIGRRCLIVRPG